MNWIKLIKLLCGLITLFGVLVILATNTPIRYSLIAVVSFMSGLVIGNNYDFWRKQ